MEVTLELRYWLFFSRDKSVDSLGFVDSAMACRYPIGTGLAGYRRNQIAPLFATATSLPNVQLPAE